MRLLCQIVLPLFLVSLFAFVQRYISNGEHHADDELHDAESHSGYRVIGNVPVLSWDSSTPFAAELAKKAQPVILKQSLASKWRAIQKWTPGYLAQRSPATITGVYSSKNSLFGPLWRPKKPMAQANITWKNPHKNIDMDSKTFFTQITQKNTDNYIYYTGDLNTPELIEDLQPIQELSLTPPETLINVWVGQSGVITHLHYDTYDNFFVQIYGTKRFLLFSPDQFRYVYEFPFLHPSFAQAQIILEQPDLKTFPNASKLEALEAIMEPGDLLYLPPMYYHQVYAETTSISVNVWSTAKQQKAHDAAIHLTVKHVSRGWNSEMKKGATKWILGELFKRVPIPDIFSDKNFNEGREIYVTAKQFIDYTLSIRYQHLLQLHELPQTIPNLCTSPNLDQLENENEDKQSLVSLLDKIVPIFQKHHRLTRCTWLMNYVETLAYWCTSSGAHASAFLSECFA